MAKKMNNNLVPKKKILAVDDEVDLLKILQLNLEANGYEVVTALDGEEALKKNKERKTGCGNFGYYASRIKWRRGV